MNNLNTYTPATYLPNYILHCKKMCKEKYEFVPSLYKCTYGTLSTSTWVKAFLAITVNTVYGLLDNCNFV